MVNMDFLFSLLFTQHQRYHSVDGEGGREHTDQRSLKLYMLEDNCKQQKPYEHEIIYFMKGEQRNFLS